MALVDFYERLSIENPRLTVKYMAHLASQIQEGPTSAKSQAIDARIAGDFSAVEKACDRADDLRAKFLDIAHPYFKNNVIMGNNCSDFDARIIYDIIQTQPVNRDYLTSPR